jgi:mRNA-degrading endonuclease YafQ of YafQ-DinJ toxin-antitoxin module
MFVINKTKYFLKKAKKLLDKNLELIMKVNKTVELLAQNPKNPKLNSHKVNTFKFGECFSSSIT